MAQERVTSFSTYGLPGLVDMPTARVAPDATISATYARLGGSNRTTLSFQIAPRLQGAFRYSAIENLDLDGSNDDGTFFDRSFDIRYLLLKEGQYWPAVVIGLQDFIGTGLYSGEYIVATKEVGPGLELTGGLGWGRYGSDGAFATLGTRPNDFGEEGGTLTFDRWFRGDVAAFGGISYSPNDRFTFSAEYSSDAYTLEQTNGEFERSSNWNFGVDYRFKSGTQLSFYYAYGQEIGAQVTLNANPKVAPVPGGRGPAPFPVSRRAADASRDLGWATQPNARASVRAQLIQALEIEKLEFQGYETDGNRTVIRIANETYHATSQAVGRTARILSRIMPASVDEFVIIPVVNGLALSAVTLQRADVEDYENAAATEILARAQFSDAFRKAPALDDEGIYPRFRWNLGSYYDVSLFDPDSPVRADAGAKLSASFEITPNVVLSGAVTQRLIGNIGDTRDSNSVLPRVRTNAGKFAATGDTALQHLTLTGYGRLAENLYGRATIGYLESMYAGVSAEVLWKPVNSRLALGVEVNAVRQREFSQGFGLGDCDDLQQNENFDDCTILTGHASAYYSFGNGYHGQLDVGRYLAGDYGATVSLDREFGNGWRVGAFATFTNVSPEDFGEGSFDKGIRVTIPLTWANGQPTQRTNTINIRPLTRDGGARLNVDGRLYERVRDYHRPEMERSWGRFWR